MHCAVACHIPVEQISQVQVHAVTYTLAFTLFVALRNEHNKKEIIIHVMASQYHTKLVLLHMRCS